MKLAAKFRENAKALDADIRKRLSTTLLRSLQQRSEAFPDLPIALGPPLPRTALQKLKLTTPASTVRELLAKLGDGTALQELNPAELLALHSAVDRAIADAATKLDGERDVAEKKAVATEKLALVRPADDAPVEEAATQAKAWVADLENVQALKTRRELLLGEPPPVSPPKLIEARELATAAEELRLALAGAEAPHVKGFGAKAGKHDREIADAERTLAMGGCDCGFGESGTVYARRCVLSIPGRRLSWSANEESSCNGLCRAWSRDDDCRRLVGSSEAAKLAAKNRDLLAAAKQAREKFRTSEVGVEKAIARLTAARKALGQEDSPPPKREIATASPAAEPGCPLKSSTLVFSVPLGAIVEIGGLRLVAPSGTARASSPPLDSCRTFAYAVRVVNGVGFQAKTTTFTATITPGFTTHYQVFYD